MLAVDRPGVEQRARAPAWSCRRPAARPARSPPLAHRRDHLRQHVIDRQRAASRAQTLYTLGVPSCCSRSADARVRPEHSTQGPRLISATRTVAQDGRLMPLAAAARDRARLWQRSVMREARPVRAQLDCERRDPDPDAAHARDARSADPRSIAPFEIRAGFELAHAIDDGDRAPAFHECVVRGRGMAGRIGARASRHRLAARRAGCSPSTRSRGCSRRPMQRKVTQPRGRGLSGDPEARYEAPAPPPRSEAPAGATWPDELAIDPTEIAFTLDQTDANQHVNSLVYIRVFLDAAQRRLAARRPPAQAAQLARVDIAYRKPSFAGDRVRAHRAPVRSWQDAPGAAGLIAGDDGKPRLLRPRPVLALAPAPPSALEPACAHARPLCLHEGLQPPSSSPYTGGFPMSLVLRNGSSNRLRPRPLRSLAIFSAGIPSLTGRVRAGGASAPAFEVKETRRGVRPQGGPSWRRRVGPRHRRPQQRAHRQRQPLGRGAPGGRELRALRAPVRLVLAQLLAPRSGGRRAHRGEARERRADADDSARRPRRSRARSRSQEVASRLPAPRVACTRRGTPSRVAS